MIRILGTDNIYLLTSRNVVTIDGFEDVPENDEAALKQAVAMQPVSVAICASGGLQFYSSGIVGGKCCDELDHGVLAVGYGVVRLVSPCEILQSQQHEQSALHLRVGSLLHMGQCTCCSPFCIFAHLYFSCALSNPHSLF